MPRKNISQVLAELDEAQDYIGELEDRLDDIAGLAAGDEDEEEDHGDHDPDWVGQG